MGTKTDLVKKQDLIKIASLVRSEIEEYPRVARKLILCSSVQQSGVHDLRQDIIARTFGKHTKRASREFKRVKVQIEKEDRQRARQERDEADGYGEGFDRT